MCFLTRKTHPLDSKLRQENYSSEPSDRWCPCVPGTFEPVVASSARPSALFHREERTSESGEQLCRSFSHVLSVLSCQFFLQIKWQLIHDFCTSTSWHLANLFGWKHHSDPKLTVKLRKRFQLAPCRQTVCTCSQPSDGIVEAMQHPRLVDVLHNDLLDMSFAPAVTLALSRSLEHLKITGCSVVRRLVLAW